MHGRDLDFRALSRLAKWRYHPRMRGWMGFVLGWVAGCGGSQVAEPVRYLAFPESHQLLKNGIRLIVLPDASTSLVEVDVRYEVGAREDPPGKAGLAHLVEHLMFQQRQAGKDKPPIAAVLRELGIYSNAFTDWDSTHYQTLALAERAEDLVALEVARLQTGCETIDADTFAREREVVRNEIRGRTSTPESQVDDLLLQAVYPSGHPYRNMVGGDDLQLSGITLDDVCQFMRSYYVPERATFIVAGGVSAELEKRILPVLGPVPARTGAPRASVSPIQLGGDRITTELDVEEPTVFAAWAMPPRTSEDWESAANYVRELAGRAAFFGLTYEFATDVSLQIVGGAEAPVLAVQVSVAERSQVEDAVDALQRAARGLRTHRTSQQAIQALANTLDSSVLVPLDGLTVRTGTFADFAQFRGIKYTLSEDVARRARYDADRIANVGRDILDVDKARFIVVLPKKGVPPRLRRAALMYSVQQIRPDELPVDRGEALRPIPVPAQAVPSSESETFVLENGLRVVLLPTRTQLPLTTIALSFRSGSAYDPAGQEGIAREAASMTFGTIPYTSLQLTPDTTVFSWRIPSFRIDRALEGMKGRVANAQYYQNAIESGQRVTGIALQRPSVRSERAFSRAWRRATFTDHPYGRDGEATLESLPNISHDSLVSYRDRVFTARNATLLLTGSFNVGHAKELIRQQFGDFPEGAPVPAMRPVPPHTPRALFRGVVGDHLETMPLSITYRVDHPLDSNYAARLVLAQMISHRVRVIREHLGASYGVHASLLTYDDIGDYHIVGSVDPLRAGESLRALRDAVGGLRRGDRFVEEFVRARRHVLGDRLVATTSTFQLAQRAVWNDRYGRGVGSENELVSAIATLTPHAVMQVMQTELPPSREVAVLLGKKPLLAKAFADAGIDDAEIGAAP